MWLWAKTGIEGGREAGTLRGGKWAQAKCVGDDVSWRDRGMRKLKDPEEKDRCGGVYGVHRALILPNVSQVEF